MGLKFSKAAMILAGFLILQGAAYYATARRSEAVPPSPPLAGLPARIADWTMVREGVVEKEVQEVLKADDTLTRWYSGPQGAVASLFIAAFRTQRDGKAPHSPKNCLPGAGWIQVVNDTQNVSVPGLAAPIEVNRYVVQKGESRSLVMYWYQSRDRAVASEYKAKVYVVADAMRYNRTDTALVRVIVDVPPGTSLEAAEEKATSFIRSSYALIRKQLPA